MPALKCDDALSSDPSGPLGGKKALSESSTRENIKHTLALRDGEAVHVMVEVIHTSIQAKTESGGLVITEVEATRETLQ